MTLSFEAPFVPVCPGCRRGSLELVEHHAGEHGVLACTGRGCDARFPVIAGLPVLVPDMNRFMHEAGLYLLTRDDLPETINDIIGAAMPPGAWFDAARHHLSGYVRDHWGMFDPADRVLPAPGQAWSLAAAGLELVGKIRGPVIELGTAAGGVTHALAQLLDVPVLGLDLSAPLVRFAARALSGGTLRYPLRLSGTAYAERTIEVPALSRGSASVWLADALAPPLPDRCAELVVALNLLDCVADPATLMRAGAALLRPGGYLMICSPRDWSTTATPADNWVGGRCRATALPDLAHWAASVSGLETVGHRTDLGWDVRIQEHAYMRYTSDLVVLRRSL